MRGTPSSPLAHPRSFPQGGAVRHREGSAEVGWRKGKPRRGSSFPRGSRSSGSATVP